MRSAEMTDVPATPEAAAGDAPRVSAARIVLILLAVMIALPAFVMGAELSHSLGAPQATLASLAGGGILAVIAAFGGALGARTRKSTYQLICDAFGTHGAKLANGALGLCILGWYGVVATMFGQALSSAAPSLMAQTPGWTLTLLGCVLTTLTAVIGFRALDIMSALTTPLKLLLLFWTFFAALRGGLEQAWAYVPAAPIPLGTGVSMVAGGLMVGAVLAPDVCRFARSPTHAAVGSALAYGFGFPLVLMLAGMPSLASGERDLVKIMLTLGLGVPAMLIVILTAWSTNTFNLYAATLIGATLRPRQPQWQLAAAAGIAGTALGLAGISNMLVPYLLLLGICIPPIAGVYLVNAWRRGAGPQPDVAWRSEAIVAWLIGSGWAALAPRWDIALTPIPALDSLLVCGVVYWLLDALARGRSSRTSEAFVG
ncbi:MAG: hypothetical protein D4S02_12665 [Rhodocyclaceae bacterium]|nr:MAG: hypothetical protein D4S02_12665 [Rhodocyclaceae bacterium]